MASVARNKVMLACTECKQRNYNTMKNKKNTPDRKVGAFFAKQLTRRLNLFLTF